MQHHITTKDISIALNIMQFVKLIIEGIKIAKSKFAIKNIKITTSAIFFNP